MSRNRFERIGLYTIAGIGVLLVAVGLLLAGEQRRTQAETGAVLSAFFSQEVLHDLDKWGAGRTVNIVIQLNPSHPLFEGGVSELDLGSWFGRSLHSRASLLSDAWFAQSSRTTRVSFFLNSVFSTDISADLHLAGGARAVFVKPSDLVVTKASDFEVRFPNNLGYFVVSHVGLNLKKNEALLYIDRHCSGLCGGGGYFLMRKANGVWHVVDSRMTWVS